MTEFSSADRERVEGVAASLRHFGDKADADSVSRLLAAYDAEKRRADGLAEDARRYRWLRDNVRVMEMCFNTNHPARWHLYGEQMDAELDRVCAIDAALAAEGPPA
jgi:hypothetical protein